MHTLGLIGGMSWASSTEYYRLLNTLAQARLGGHHNARSLMLTVDFAGIEALQRAGDWRTLGAQMASAAEQLQRGGAGAIVLCTNTMHKLADEIIAAVDIPLLHIADATAAAVSKQKLSRVALLGTRFTMEQDFYRARLFDRYGIEVLIPDDAERADIHRIIYDELCHHDFRASSRQRYQQIIERLADRGAQGVILGCTEIPLLISPQDSVLPTFDTTRLHVEYALEWALAAEKSAH